MIQQDYNNIILHNINYIILQDISSMIQQDFNSKILYDMIYIKQQDTSYMIHKNIIYIIQKISII